MNYKLKSMYGVEKVNLSYGIILSLRGKQLLDGAIIQKIILDY